MNPSHDNTQDAADLEIARLKAELEEARAEHQAYRAGAKREWQHQYDKRNRAESDAEALRAELSRLTEERRKLRELLLECRRFVIAAVEDRVQLEGFNPAQHVTVVAIDALLSSGDSE